MRIPLAVSLESRDGGVTKDAKVINGLAEKIGDSLALRKRPGVSDLGLVKAGTAQLLTIWNGVKAVFGDYLNAGSISTITSSPVQTNLSPTNASLQFTSAYTTGGAATPRLFFKNRSQGWVVNRAGTVSTVTYASAMGAGTYNVLSLTRTSNTATATLAEDVFNVGDSVTMAGAGQAAYNGSFTITATTAGSTIPAVNLALTLTRSGTTATGVTSVAHGLTTGTYTISGANSSAYNGAKSLTVVDATTFTYTVTVTGPPTTTWNPADKDGSIALANGNLTVGIGGFGGNTEQSARCTVGKSSGKWYWEFTPGSITPSFIVGVGNSSAALTNFPGDDLNGWGYSTGGTKWHASHGGGSAYGASWSTNDVIGVALDMDSGTLTFYKNNVSQGQAFSGITGTIYPMIGGFASTASTGTANFGATATVYVPPAGFAALYSDDPVSPATGSPVVTRPGSVTNPTFSYTVAGSPATPATGTITASNNGGTVPGAPYINGYFCVMDVNGVVWSSAVDDPTTWPALQFYTANAEPGTGRALAKSLNYLIALKEWSTEFAYNDPNQATGSPFIPVQNGFTLIGCANGDSVAEVMGNLCWIAQTKYAPGRSVYMQHGLDQQKISTPDVERILNGDLLSTVYAYGLNLDGHPLYVLTLTNSNITLVYDIAGQVWMQWSSLAIGNTVSVSTITRSGTTATVTTGSAHGLNDGDPVSMAGANQNEYNGIFQVQYVSPTVFTIQVAGSPTTPATGTITSAPYSETYFKFTKSANYNGATLLLHETNGHLYQFSSSLKQDAGVPINWFARTTRLDGGALQPKRIPKIRVIGDKVSDICMIRWSDDDCTTFSSYRFVDMSLERPEIRRCGAFKRRTLELRHVGNSSPTLTALEFDPK